VRVGGGVNLIAIDRHFARRLDAKANLLAGYRENRDLDLITDHDALIRFSR
jgi:hypothetical protein